MGHPNRRNSLTERMRARYDNDDDDDEDKDESYTFQITSNIPIFLKKKLENSRELVEMKIYPKSDPYHDYLICCNWITYNL